MIKYILIIDITLHERTMVNAIFFGFGIQKKYFNKIL